MISAAIRNTHLFGVGVEVRVFYFHVNATGEFIATSELKSKVFSHGDKNGIQFFTSMVSLSKVRSVLMDLRSLKTTTGRLSTP